uniref:E3 ubiquitin-protein ligase listerin n=1 Tax=Arcella intermedia TaxID=1963864 RepID=A0A6B2LIL2_9EUKA
MDELSKIQAYNRESSMENKVDNTEFTSNLTPEGATFSVSCVRGSSNQVVATYKKDEVQATIVLALADNHPLRAVAINSSNRIGVNEATWRKWLLSMTTVLLTQDGSVLDAVLLWRSSLDNFLEGVELCPICYALFHSSNYSIPNLSCKTCKSKFHGACLYKWFHTSMKNECPMCKTLFN